MASSEIVEQIALDPLREEAAKGLAAIENGDYVDLKPEDIGSFIQKLAQQADQRLAAEEGR